MVKPRKPDLLCIGAQKAGTTWLHEILSQRDDVWVPPFKEVHFFDHKFIPEFRRWTRQHIRSSVELARKRRVQFHGKVDPEFSRYLDGILEKPWFNGTWYQHVFSRAPEGAVALDVTPEYCAIPSEGIDYILKFLGHVKIIYIVRRPVDRAISQIKMNARRHKVNPKNEREWVELISDPNVFHRGDYRKYIPRWRQKFIPGDILFLPFGQIKDNPRRLLSQIETFMGWREFRYDRVEIPVNTSQDFSIPEFAIERLEFKLKEQDEFLIDTFGENFFQTT